MTIKKNGKIQIQLKFKASISHKKLYGIFEKKTTDWSTINFTYKDINGYTYSTKFSIDLYYKNSPTIKYELFNNVKKSSRIENKRIIFFNEIKNKHKKD